VAEEIPLEALQHLARAAAACHPNTEARERVWLELEQLLEERPLHSFGAELEVVARSLA
jgi:hypothetical protein